MITSDARNKWFVLVGLIVLSLVFHTYNLDFASYDLDEAVHIWHAQKTYAEVIEQSSNDPNPPVYNLILSTWVKLFGVSEWTTRFFSVLMGVLGVGVMFLIASRNFGLAVGITAALFYCFSPIQFRFTHLARPYSMLMITVLLSYGMLMECIKRPKTIKLFLYYISTVLMIYVHPTSVFNIPAQGLIIILLGFKEPRRVMTLLATLVAAFLSFGIWMLAIPYFERNDSMWFGPPDWNAVYYVIEKFYGSWKILLLQGGILLALVVQVILGKSKVNKTYLTLIAIWIVVPFVASVTFSYVIKPVFQDKYILTVQPAIILLLAYTIHALGNRLVQIVLGIGVVVVLFQSTKIEPSTEGDWKHAVEYVKPLHTENSLVFIDPWYEFRTFSYYFDRHAYEVPDSTLKILVAKGATTAWHDVYDTIAGNSRTKVVHVFRAHQGAVKPSIDIEQLETLATLVAEKSFAGINVRTYSFVVALDTLKEEVLSFDEEKAGVEAVSSESEFSKAIVFPLSEARTNHNLRVTASADLSATESMEGVAFVVSTEKNGFKHDYWSKNVLASGNSNEFLTFTEQFNLRQFENDWEIKVYVWNPRGRQFQIDNLKLIVEN